VDLFRSLGVHLDQKTYLHWVVTIVIKISSCNNTRLL